MDDEQLLRQYVRERSEAAFSELVARHIDLVYAAALRIVHGDTHLAEDVAQVVFMDLARKAQTLPRGVILAGWLHRHACFTASTAVRTERRRRVREQIAMEMRELEENQAPQWEQVARFLDEGLNQLSDSDRGALVLRYLKSQNLRAVGSALGISEDAAQKRVNRALEKLRKILSRRGLAVNATTLASVLGAQAATTAPAGLAANIATASLAAGAKSGTTLTMLKLMAATKLKTAVIGTIIFASMAVPLMLQQKAAHDLQLQDEALRQQTRRLGQIRAENAQLALRPAAPPNTRSLTRDQFNELLKLRGEAGRLRKEAQKMADIEAFREKLAQLPLDQVWPERIRHLKEWLEAHPSETVPELSSLPARSWINSSYPFSLETDEECRRAMSIVRANAEGRTRSNLLDALHQYAQNNGGQFAQDISELKPYLNPSLDDEILARYTILPVSSLPEELRPPGENWVITEKAPVNAVDDSRNAMGLRDSRWANQSVTNRWLTSN